MYHFCPTNEKGARHLQCRTPLGTTTRSFRGLVMIGCNLPRPQRAVKRSCAHRIPKHIIAVPTAFACVHLFERAAQ
jgi:hypothetical protein